MYLAHFGLSEPPFRITPHTEFFFEGANRGATLEALIYAVTHDEGIVKVTGEVGSGKTMLCRVLLERLPPPVVTIYLANPSLGRDEILLTIAEELKVDTSGKRTTVLLRALQDALIQLYAQGNRVIVLIDEAHAMPAETLEEIRLLSNLESNRHKLLQIILFGQPELEEHLNLPNMRQLRERITHSFRLEPLVRSDIDNYIDFRMRAAGYKGPNVFARPALKIIARASEGLTRRINILADKSLLAAFADNSHQVTPKHAKAAVDDSGFRRMRRVRPGWWVAAGTLALGLALGVAIQYVVAPRVNGPASSPAAPPAAVPAATPASAPASPSAPAPGTGSSANKDGTALTVQPPGPSTGQAGGIGAGGVPAGEPAGGKMQLTPSNLQTNAANSGQVARAAMGTSSAATIPSGDRGADAERAEQADRPAATAGMPRMPPPSGLASSTAPAAAASPAAGATANPSSPASGAPVIAARMAATSSATA